MAVDLIKGVATYIADTIEGASSRQQKLEQQVETLKEIDEEARTLEDTPNDPVFTTGSNNELTLSDDYYHE